MSPPQGILIVGGGEGIGLEITKAILAASSTAEIVVFGLHMNPELRAHSEEPRSRVSLCCGDVTSKSYRKKALDTCFNEFGGIDTLVYCAGVITPIERIERIDIEDVKRAYDVNVFGAMAMVHLNINISCAGADNPTVGPDMPSLSTQFSHLKSYKCRIRKGHLLVFSL